MARRVKAMKVRSRRHSSRTRKKTTPFHRLVLRGTMALVAVLACFLLWGATDQTTSFAQRELQAAQQLATEAQDAWEQAQEQLRSLITRVQQLEKSVAAAEDKKAILPKVIYELERITIEFENLARSRQQIEETLRNRVQQLYALPTAVEAKIQALQDEKTRVTARIVALERAPSPENDIHLKAARNLLKDLDLRISLWIALRDQQLKIADVVAATHQKIALLVTTIEQNVVVFKSKCTTLRETGEVLSAFALLKQGLPELDQWTLDISNSWNIVDSLVQELVNFALSFMGKG
ncbi:MAG: hypothetical protein QW734_04460 [Candidatus Bathyarchaeia archaeon]